MWHLLILCLLIPQEVSVTLIHLNDGDSLTDESVLYFGLEGMGIAPYMVEAANTGHHHLLVNHHGSLPTGRPMKTGTTNICFEGGETQVTLAQLEIKSGKLSGTVTLQLVFVDFHEVQFDPVIQSKPVEVVVAP